MPLRKNSSNSREKNGRSSRNFSNNPVLRGKHAEQLRNFASDPQSEPASIAVLAGVCELKTIYRAKRWSMPIKLSILTATRNHRAVHMSRLVSAAQKNTEGTYIEDSLRNVCREVNRTQPGCILIAEFDYPFRDQFLPVKIELSEDGPAKYTFTRAGMTSCPCSRRILGVGHMQRSSLKMKIVSDEILNFEEVSLRMGECFSAETKEFLKRTEEAELVARAQSNSRFVEDLVRECLKRFPSASKIEARSFESVHTHDAVAMWSRALA